MFHYTLYSTEMKDIEPANIGLTTTTHRKTIKYKDFKNILKREWELKNVTIIPIVIGVTGIYGKSLNRNRMDLAPNKS